MEVFVINLDRRPDRWEQVQKELEKAGIVATRVAAVDGYATQLPPGWKSGPGAYGCSMSHRMILQDCLARGVDEALILEDDVTFVDSFQDRYAAFLSSVPGDWDVVFLGGQHLSPPVTTGLPGVVRCSGTAGCHRTHAYLVKRHFMDTLVRLWSDDGHIDHLFGRVQHQYRVYAPTVPLAAQGASRSDIANREYAEDRWWPVTKIVDSPVNPRPYPRKHHPGRPARPVARPVKTTFSHAGDLGDLLYAIPTIRRLCCDTPSDLILYPATFVRESFTPEKVERVRSFLECQPWVSSVRFADRPEGVVVDNWRKRRQRRGANLADVVADWAGVAGWDVRTPWVTVDTPTRVAKYVFHRSPRYRTTTFPWKDIVTQHGADAVFVGSADEHQDFVAEFGPVTYHPTPTLLDLARTLAGAEGGFIGNQSAPRALAEALKVTPIRVEEFPGCPNTHFSRPDARYG